jgi:anti-sigma factor RsiW
MNCGQISEDDLQAYVDGLLTARQAAAVDAWLSAHPEQRARVDGYARDRAALRAALAPIAQEPIPSELDVRRIAAGRGRFRWRSASQIAAALALTVGGGSAGWLLRGAMEPPRAGIASLAREASQNYVVYAPDRNRPVELGADARQALISWGSERLARPVGIPDLGKAGFAFLGGRLVATPHGPAVLAMYSGSEGTRLAILVRDMEIDQNAPMAERSEDGIGAVTWARKGIGYSLVGAQSAASLHPIADMARAQID